MFQKCRVLRCLQLVIVVLIAGTLSARAGSADEINWGKFMTNSSNAAAIASALSWVDDCGKKLKVWEEKTGRTIKLDFLCKNENGESSVTLYFDVIGDVFIMPKSFEFAG